MTGGAVTGGAVTGGAVTGAAVTGAPEEDAPPANDDADVEVDDTPPAVVLDGALVGELGAPVVGATVELPVDGGRTVLGEAMAAGCATVCRTGVVEAGSAEAAQAIDAPEIPIAATPTAIAGSGERRGVRASISYRLPVRHRDCRHRHATGSWGSAAPWWAVRSLAGPLRAARLLEDSWAG